VRRVPFSRFARSEPFSAVLGASGPFFLFCAPGLVFGGTKGVPFRFHVFRGTKGVGSCFHVLRSRTHFRRYRGRRVPFSRFAFQDSFSAVSGASGPVFLFARPDSFSSVPRASGPVFMFCAPRLVFGGIEGVGSRFHVLRSRAHFGRY
jgi:hypothetical protein